MSVFHGYQAIVASRRVNQLVKETLDGDMDFLRKTGFLYLVWALRHPIQFIWISSELMQFWTWTSPHICTIQLNLINLFLDFSQLWKTSTCVGLQICPERVSLLYKCSPTNLGQSVVCLFSILYIDEGTNDITTTSKVWMFYVIYCIFQSEFSSSTIICLFLFSNHLHLSMI